MQTGTGLPGRLQLDQAVYEEADRPEGACASGLVEPHHLRLASQLLVLAPQLVRARQQLRSNSSRQRESQRESQAKPSRRHYPTWRAVESRLINSYKSNGAKRKMRIELIVEYNTLALDLGSRSTWNDIIV